MRRDALRFDGAFVDAIVMSILRPEWEASREQIAG
ncbi:RimJ/RimL family protein N-acetyltransferase [Agromyces ramosus]|uniref:RimJ/RimL family protein N-acetyltransferase n=1 Tax=Agromyces ramosus TaxID=33879 RepID=A0ABU0RAE0_9MICO|nr:RimJ/RimL family protein N-acetyltransferase [Agromyces ramosus]